MNKTTVNIVGCGIVGLVTAVVIKNFLPEIIINMYDADSHPENTLDLVGVTFGKGRDARHFTGSESLSFQNPVHSRALVLSPGENKDWAGWKLIDENHLTDNELKWRADSLNKYSGVGHENINEYDYFHARFNYAGMLSWKFLQEHIPYLSEYQISNSSVSVLFLTKNNFDADLLSEKIFLERFGKKCGNVTDSVIKKNIKNLLKADVYEKGLELPGSSWRIRSLGLRILSELEEEGVVFHWNKEIVESEELKGDIIVWTAGTTHKVPEIYKKYSLIQGIAGCWVSIPNKGFEKPFKISLPQPSGYINCTPDNDVLHISGGFGWVGERSYNEAAELMNPICTSFKEQIYQYFGISIKDMDTDGKYPLSVCIRPATPTGLPDVGVRNFDSIKNIILTGSGKSGSTQASLLALYAIGKIDSKIIDKKINQEQIKDAIEVLGSLDKVHDFV